MKKLFLVSLMMGLIFSVTACTKTEVEEDLTESMETEILTPEDETLLKEEDAEFREDFIEEMMAANEENRLEEGMEIVNEIEDAEDAKKAGKKGRGSCEAIEEGSTCLEYYGDFWTEAQMRANCEGSGVFSTKACPADTAGGCNTGVGTDADMVAWMYLRGGGGMTSESLKYAKMACDMTMASKWLTR